MKEDYIIGVIYSFPPQGSHPEAILHCDVEGMSESLLLVLSAEVHGLAVNYTVQEKWSEELFV